MVIPMGGGMSMPQEEATPEKITTSHCCWWWMVIVLFTATFVGCLVALKIFDALIVVVIAIWAYYLTKDRCQGMTQQCLFSFGLVCVIQAVMDFIILAMSLPGRRTQSTTAHGPQGGGHAAPSPFMHGAGSSSYTVTVETTPFFSEEQGWHYNLQSAMMIASCVVFIIGAIMSKVSYAEYPNSLFDDASEGRPISGSSFGASGGGGRHYSGGGGGRPAGGNSFGGGQRPGVTFGGSGQRLGSA